MRFDRAYRRRDRARADGRGLVRARVICAARGASLWTASGVSTRLARSSRRSGGRRRNARPSSVPRPARERDRVLRPRRGRRRQARGNAEHRLRAGRQGHASRLHASLAAPNTRARLRPRARRGSPARQGHERRDGIRAHRGREAHSGQAVPRARHQACLSCDRARRSRAKRVETHLVTDAATESAAPMPLSASQGGIPPEAKRSGYARQTIAPLAGATLVECRLETGGNTRSASTCPSLAIPWSRTRVHPRLRRSKDRIGAPDAPRARSRIVHPRTGQSMSFEREAPDDFRR